MLTIADHLMTQNERRTKRRTTPQRQGPRPLHTRHARCGTVTSKQTRTRESPCEYSGRGVVVEQLQRFGIAAMRSRWTGGNQWIGTSIVWLEGARYITCVCMSRLAVNSNHHQHKTPTVLPRPPRYRLSTFWPGMVINGARHTRLRVDRQRWQHRKSPHNLRKRMNELGATVHVTYKPLRQICVRGILKHGSYTYVCTLVPSIRQSCLPTECVPQPVHRSTLPYIKHYTYMYGTTWHSTGSG